MAGSPLLPAQIVTPHGQLYAVRDDRVFDQGKRPIAQIGQMFQTAHNSDQQFLQFRLGRIGAGLLLDGHLHQWLRHRQRRPAVTGIVAQLFLFRTTGDGQTILV